MNFVNPAAVRPYPLASCFRLGVGLLLTPVAVLIAARVMPHVQLGEMPANVTAFAGATVFPILGLSLAAIVEPRWALAFVAALLAAAVLVAVSALRPAPLVTVAWVDGALVCLSWALGCSLGRRVQHAAHLLPACVVVASADLVSVLSPEGPSHAIAGSDRALSVLALWFPVPGGSAVAPALGAGDLLFMALVFGVARAHGLPYARCVVACAVGTALAGLAAAWTRVAVPALLPIAATLVLALPPIRKLRRSDRRAAHWSMLVASTLALACVLRSLLNGR